MSVRAKFKVVEKIEREHGHAVTLNPVTSGSDENEIFYHYTPAGQIELTTINPGAAAAFAVGAEYYVDFVPATTGGE